MSQGQNLIERTKLGLSCHSTESPNRLSQEVVNLKSSREIDLFTWDDRKSANPLDEINLKMNRKYLSQLKQNPEQSWILKIPVSTESHFNVQMKPFNVLSSEGQLLTQEGPVSSTNKMQFFRGVIEGDHGSLVTASIINGELHMSIADQDGMYRISPNDYKSDNYSIWIDNSLTEKEFTCGVDESPQLERNTDITITPSKESNQKAAGDVIQVYVECDFELHNDKGGVPSTEAFVAQLFAEIITLYANESINIEVSDIFVWTSVDPYAGNTNLVSLLNLFGSNKQNAYNGRLATLLKGDVNSMTGSCSTSGFAWVDVLCNTYVPGSSFGPYNVNQGIGQCPLNPNPTIAWDALDVSLVAHELGHNIASDHTHSCVWGPNNDLAIDNCPGFTDGGCSLVTNPTPPAELGTIMSYCAGNVITFSKGFGTEPGDLMRSRVAAASCLAPGAQPCTDVDKTYNNATVSTTTIRADNNITLLNTVDIAASSQVNWFFENEFTVNGIFTVPSLSQLEIVVEDCQ